MSTAGFVTLMVIFGLVVIVLLVLAAIVIYRRRKRHLERKREYEMALRRHNIER